MGENPSRVYNSGAPGLDNIYKLKLKNKKELFNKLSLKTDNKYFLITFHPVTLEKDTAETSIDELLNALSKFPDYKFIFTMPNADTDGRIIYQKIQKYLSDYPSRGKLFKSLGQLDYLSTLKYSSLIIGNSSSGLIEAPSFKVPTVNIGNRQKRRIKAESVIDTRNTVNETLMNYDNLPGSSNDITYDFLQEYFHLDYEVAGYDRQKLVRKRLLKNLRMLRNVYNKY